MIGFIQGLVRVCLGLVGVKLGYSWGQVGVKLGSSWGPVWAKQEPLNSYLDGAFFWGIFQIPAVG